MSLYKITLQMKNIARLLYRWNKQFNRSICTRKIKKEFLAQAQIRINKRRLRKKITKTKLQFKFLIFLVMNQHNRKKKFTLRLSLSLKVWVRTRWLKLQRLFLISLLKNLFRMVGRYLMFLDNLKRSFKLFNNIKMKQI
jgi:hypothetical protein